MKYTIGVITGLLLTAASGISGQTPVPSLTGERPSSSKSDLIINRMGSMNNLSSGDLFTGSANITVPFYEQGKNNINLGVALHFNTKGVKVDEHSGNTVYIGACPAAGISSSISMI